MKDYRDPKIRVTADGRWFSEYGEVTHQGVKRYFQQILDKQDEDYFLSNGKQKVKIDVNGYVFWVEAIRERPWKGKLWIWLVINDDTEEPLDPETLRILPDNSFECKIKGGKFPAKFTLSSYWQLVEHIEEKEGKFYLKIGDHPYPLEGSHD
ncbi:DUF1285 domain-containing protein [Thermosulfidibacter takaii]|nr:DUF1285 domain-containing protein [Thermosulfidibacter takaii]